MRISKRIPSILAVSVQIILLGDVANCAEKPNIIVILTDDLGYADVGIQGCLDDLLTPNTDRLAREGVRFTNGYVTAPQCVPSRAGILSGQYQTRFGVDAIGKGPMPTNITTIAERLRDGGYATGMVGKWHLDPGPEDKEWIKTNLSEKEALEKKAHIPESLRREYSPGNQGFTDYFEGYLNSYRANYTLDRNDLVPQTLNVPGDRIGIQTDAALAFIDRHKEKPFFLYLAYFAPHTPLVATDESLALFPGKMPERRRLALAMISSIDDGVGRILSKLKETNLDESTLIFYTSDNGAPLERSMPDDPIPASGPDGGWDGSRNDPLNGEKGTLLEGGIRVPFLLRWKGTIPPGQVIAEPVITLDIAATSVALAGLSKSPELDGTDLLPLVTGKGLAERSLYWRFWHQAAIRKGTWKYITLSDGREWLFDLNSAEEKVNRIADHPEIAQSLRADLKAWAEAQKRSGLPTEPPNASENRWYEHYLNQDANH